jgi:tetratricopeptide (TPR) repeat protein
MKKLTLSLLAFVLLANASNFAQTPALDALKKLVKATKSIGEDKKKIEAADLAVSEAAKFPELVKDANFLLAKGKSDLAKASYDNSERIKASTMGKPYQTEFLTAAMSASTSLVAAAKATQDKKLWKEISAALLETQSYLDGAAREYSQVEADDKRQEAYKNSYLNFKEVTVVHDVLKANAQKSRLDDAVMATEAYRMAALLAYYSESHADAIPFYEKMVTLGKDTSFHYNGLYKAKVATDEAAAMKDLEAGRKKFPEDTQLLFTEINHYFKKGNLEVLIDRLKQGLQREPSNAGLLFSLGNVYDQISQKKETPPEKVKEYEAEAQTYYAKTLEVDPKNTDAIYSLGAAFYNKAAIYSKEMKALESDFSKEGTKKYKAAEVAMLAEFEKALPYFKKAEALDPNSPNTLIALKEIFARKDDLKTSGEFKARLDNVNGGGKNATSYFKD